MGRWFATDGFAYEAKLAGAKAKIEQAGGREAWAGLGEGVGSMAIPSGASPKPCPAFSGQV